LLFPLVFLIPTSLHPQAMAQFPTAPTLRWYAEIPGNTGLIRSVTNSVSFGLAVAAVTTPLAFFAAKGTQRVSQKSKWIGLFVLPLFIPGVSMGMTLSVYFQMLGVNTGFTTVVMAHVLWAFPFAYIVILTVLSTFNAAYREAAYDLGAGSIRTFIDIELPQIRGGLLGAATFSFILSFNELARTQFVRGAGDTLPTFINSQVINVGISPEIYAISGLTVFLSLTLIGLAAVLTVLWR
jgi:ABC-type spermidine/putrescine transport system permease subunit II